MKIKQRGTDRIFNFVNYTFLILVLTIVLYPMIYILSSSLSSTNAVISGAVWLYPVEPTLIGYKAVFSHPQIMRGFLNSFIYVILGTGISVTLTLMAAYPLSRKDLFGSKFIMMMFTFTMLFNGGLIPSYLIVDRLGLINTIWAMVIPSSITVWYVILARTYFVTTIPMELYEASELDGCSDMQFIARIVIPLSGPIIAVMVLFYAVGQWNAYFDALIFLKSMDLYPLQIILRNILIQAQVAGSMMVNVEQMMRMQGMADLLKFSLIVVASLPVLIIYPFVQKYFVKGIMVGAIKG